MAKRKRNETNPEIETSQNGFPEPESGSANRSKKITVRRVGGKVIVSVPVRFYRRNGRQMILAEGVEGDPELVKSTPPNNALLNALAKGYVWQQQIEAGQFEGLEDVARANGVDRSYVGRVLQLTSLAPDIIESILAGNTYADISLQRCRKGIPVAWEEQRQTLTSSI